MDTKRQRKNHTASATSTLVLDRSPIEKLPVQLIGNIITRLGAARNVVLASATCQKWQHAWRNHVHTLTFNSTDLSSTPFEVLITQTIFQTKELESLTIITDAVVGLFSAAPVIAWLMYTRETLRYLHFHARTFSNINILEKCGRKKLQVLKLSHITIPRRPVDRIFYQKFPCLTSLSLSYIRILAWDLRLLVAACPKIEELSLVGLDIVMSYFPEKVVELIGAHSLKDVYVEAISVDEFILEADGLENLHLKDCTLGVFELIGKGLLKFLKIDGVSVDCVKIGESGENLEIVDVSNFTVVREKFYQMFSGSSKLRELWLWDVVFDNEDEIGNFLCSVSWLFPMLSHLCLNYDVNYGCSFIFENVIVLELGWTGMSEVLLIWLSGFLNMFPRLGKLVLHGPVSDMEIYENFDMLVNFKSSVVRLMRMHLQVEVLFVYD